MEKKINAIVISKIGMALMMVSSLVLTISRSSNYFLEIQMVPSGKSSSLELQDFRKNKNLYEYDSYYMSYVILPISYVLGTNNR